MPKIRAGSLREHHLQTWDLLLDALEQLSHERGPAAINLADIARRAGVARNTVYNYAPDKETLLRGLAERAGRGSADRVAVIAATDEPAAARLAAIVDEIVASFAGGAFRFALIEGDASRTSPVGDLPYATILEHVRRVVLDGEVRGEFDLVDDPARTVTLLAGLVRSGVESAAALPAPDRARTGRTITLLLLRALGASRG